MAGYPRSDIDANNWQTVTPDDWSWLDHLKAYSSDARTALGNLGSNILDGVSPFAPTATQQGQPSLQVPPMLQGIADSYSRLAGTPSKPGNAYDLTGVPELDAPIQGDMSNVLLSLYGGNALRGRGPALRSEKHRSDTTAHHIVDAELMPDDFRFGASSNVQEASSKFWPTSWGPEDISQWPSSTIERARLFVRRQEAEDQWVPMVDNIMWPDANRQQVMGRSEAEALLLSQRPELKTVADAVYSARRDFYENANPNWRNDPYRVLNEPRYPGVPSPLTEVPNVLSRPKSDVATRYLLSDTGKPSLLGSALATAGEQPKGITAYHGSPHDFDKFSLDKIGTGEGAQAYGHGLYFAENEGVAKSYRDTLAATKTSQQDLNSIVDGQDISRSDKSFLKRVADAKWNHREQGDYSQLIDEYTNLFGPPDNIEAVKKAAEALPNGKMYQVRINADPESFLDWDKPLSQQSQNARNALAAIPNSGPRYEAWDRHGNNVSVNDGATPYLGTYDEAIKAAGKGGRVVADESYNDLQSLIRGNEDKLKEAGIPGIRYLDGNSRGKGEGSSNYVVFDDSLIEILKKYGLAGGAVGAGALNSLSQDPQIY